MKLKKTEAKRQVGRLRRDHKLENGELDINELHDFNHQWYSEHYIRFYQEIVVLTNTRTSTFKQEEVRNYYASSGIYRNTTRVFTLQDSEVRKIC